MEQAIRLAYGDYKPDLAALINDGLSVAKNTVPVLGGYDSIRALKDLATFGTIDERPRGSIAGIDGRGNPFNFVGTKTKLFALRGTTTVDPDATVDVSRESGVPYNCSAQTYWEFDIFGRNVIAVNPNDDPQYFTLGVSTKFQRLGNPLLTDTKAPRAKTIGTIGTFLVLGFTFDSINGLDESAIHWSALNDIFNWPNPRSEVAVAVQSDRQPLSGSGGAVQRVVSGAEVAGIFQETAIWRADYRGGGAVFELNRVEPDRGLLIPAIAVPFGRQVFHLAEDGFYLWDYTKSTPIGHEIVDKTFLADLDSSLSHRVTARADPDNKRIHILYAGTGHDAAGTPNRELVYDWALDRFSGPNEYDAELLTRVIDAGLTLDSPHTTADPNTDGVDGAGLVPFDQRIAAPGSVRLGAWSVDQGGGTYKLQDFSGAILAGTLETGTREIIAGSRSLVNRIRPLVDASDPTIQVAALRRANDKNPRFNNAKRIDEDGDAPVRVDGRYHRIRTNLAPNWRNALAMDVYAQVSGNR